MGITRSCLSVREWLTIAEAAREVRRSRRTVERWLVDGLPCVRVLGVRYVHRDVLFARLRAILVAEPEVKTRREG